MTQDQEVQQQAEPSAEELQQQEQAAFDAGFSEVSGEEPPAREPAAEEAPEATPVEDEETVSETPIEELTEEEIAGLPVSKVRELLSKAANYDTLKADYEQHRDRLYGTVGELKKRLQDLSSQPAQTSGVKITPDGLKRLRGEYPELAQLLAEDLSEAISTGGSVQSQFDPQQLNEMLSQRDEVIVDRVTRKYEERMLALAHPDWQQVATSSEFNLWKDMLPPEDRQQLENSWDSQIVAQGLTSFKTWQQQQQQKTVSKKQRLERAVQPAGVPATSDTATEFDAFTAGFNAVRGTR